MPKEIMYDEAGMYDAVVGWQPDGCVQLGIKPHNQTSITITADGDQQASFDSLWGTFDRAGVNRLIKTLRHARDAAYGRDE